MRRVLAQSVLLEHPTRILRSSTAFISRVQNDLDKGDGTGQIRRCVKIDRTRDSDGPKTQVRLTVAYTDDSEGIRFARRRVIK